MSKFTQHPAAAFAHAFTDDPILDAVAAPKTKSDRLLDAAEAFEEAGAKMAVAAAVQAWAGTDAGDLEDGETMGDRLIALVIGAAAPEADGELTEDQANMANAYLEMAAGYMAREGASEADISAAIDGGDDDAASRIADFISSEASGDEEAEGDKMSEFAFGDDENEAAFDSVLDAVYKKRFVIRGGKKLRINKRISGSVRLSGAQRVAIRKAHLKSNSATAKIHRAKSMRVRKQMGIK